MKALSFSFLAIAVLYALLIWLIGSNWKRHRVFHPSGKEAPVRLSVVIAFRNESAALPGCLRSLERQSLSQERFEVILADDHSTDGSSAYAAAYCRSHHGFRYCPPTDERTGKKAALTRGIRLAANELIVLTDADCTADEHWLETVAAFHAAGKPDMIIGLVDMEVEGGWMAAFQELEFLSLTGVAAGAAAMKRPLYCSSANLAFTKTLFEEYPDPLRMDMVSGDDTFFLHQVKKNGTHAIKLLKSRRATVTTTGQNSLLQFLHQRMRWSSKSIRYQDADTILAALLTLLMNLVLLASLAMMVCGNLSWLFPVLFLIKTSADLFLMKDVLAFFGKGTALPWFVLYELLYMAYVTVTVPASFVVRMKWKRTTGV